MPPFELIPLATVTVTRGDIRRLGETPFSRRVIGSIADGRWEGERIKGSMIGAGGDWAIPTAGHIMLLDVRQLVETDDGALVYLTYGGRLDLANRANGLHAMVGANFETGDERYAWLNGIQAVGQGRSIGDQVVYEMFEVR